MKLGKPPRIRHRSPTKRPEAVLFDWDDTLFNMESLLPVLTQKVIDACAKVDGLTPDEFNSQWHNGTPAREAVCQRYFHCSWERMMDIFNEYYLTLPTKDIALLKDAENVIASLKAKGIRRAIVSNKARALVIRELEHFGFTVGPDGDFEVVVGKHDDKKKRKPSPFPLHEALDEMGLEIEDVWFVGDSLDDMQAARRCARRFHIHHADERHNLIRQHVQYDDMHPEVTSLRNLEEFNAILSKFRNRDMGARGFEK